MTQEEKRIKLAKAAGWTKVHQSWTGQKMACIPNDSQILPLPDYFNDLNAVHELEQHIWSKEWNLRDKFCDHLALIIDPVHGYRGLKATDALQATASQRAEALGLTLGLWNITK
jgi:hypothetical protein